MLVKPHLLRDVDSEFDAFNLEEASVRRKLAATTQDDSKGAMLNGMEPLVTVVNHSSGGANKVRNRIHLQEHKYETCLLHERLREIEADKNELGRRFSIRPILNVFNLISPFFQINYVPRRRFKGTLCIR